MAIKQPDFTLPYLLWESQDGEQVVTSMNVGVGLSAYPMTYLEGKTYYPDVQAGSAITAYETLDDGRVDYNRLNLDNVFYDIYVVIDAVSGNSSSVIKMNETTGWTSNPFESVAKHVKVRLDDNYAPEYSFIKESFTRPINFVDPDDSSITHTGYGLVFIYDHIKPDDNTKIKHREYTLYLNNGVFYCYWTESEYDAPDTK